MLALSIENLKKTYDGGLDALKSIKLEIESGDFFALLGPNGAGKSTTIGILCGLVRKTAGSVSVFGHDLDTQPVACKTAIGLVPQEFNFNPFEKVGDICLQSAGYYGVPKSLAYQRLEDSLKLLNLWGKRNVPGRNLSGGMKRRMMIARAMMHDPDLLILDEPTAGVDVELRHQTWAFMQEANARGKTIILTTHYLEEAESLCKNLAIINDGNIVKHGRMRQVLSGQRQETFVLALAEPQNETLVLDGLTVRQPDTCTLEVDLPEGKTLNDVFASLTGLGITVRSSQPKANRLESLFLALTRGTPGEAS